MTDKTVSEGDDSKPLCIGKPLGNLLGRPREHRLIMTEKNSRHSREQVTNLDDELYLFSSWFFNGHNTFL
jgi:hypothetical protein